MNIHQFQHHPAAVGVVDVWPLKYEPTICRFERETHKKNSGLICLYSTNDAYDDSLPCVCPSGICPEWQIADLSLVLIVL